MFVHPTNTGAPTGSDIGLELAFLSMKNYFYQHQNITIIIKGKGETFLKSPQLFSF